MTELKRRKGKLILLGNFQICDECNNVLHCNVIFRFVMTALPGQTNEGLEMTPDTQRKIFPRSDTTLTQVVMMIMMMIMIMIR